MCSSDLALLLQLLGVSPLLAVTTSAIQGVALGIATAAVLIVTNSVGALVRRAVVATMRLPLLLLVAAALVTAIDLLGSAFLDELHASLGVFLPLIVANCTLVAQAGQPTTRRPVLRSVLAGFAVGFGALGVLVALGALREVLGHGTLFAGLPLLMGERTAGLALDLHLSGMLIAVLPPGAFLAMAALLAVRARLLRPQREAGP